MLWRLAVIRLRQMSGVFEQSATGPEQIFVPPSVNGGQFLRSADLERARHD
jgi:hypothetical protein